MWAADGLADAVVDAAQAATTVDRLAEDLEIFASPPFGYVTLDASLCRASVLMPQKRNPYALAVIRAGAGTLIGRATGLLVTQRTPSARTDNWLHAYGEVASALDLARRVVALGAEVVRTLAVHREALAAAASAHFTGAADLAEELVLAHGLDYRSAYRLVARSVAAAIEDGRTRITEARHQLNEYAAVADPREQPCHDRPVSRCGGDQGWRADRAGRRRMTSVGEILARHLVCFGELSREDQAILTALPEEVRDLRRNSDFYRGRPAEPCRAGPVRPALSLYDRSRRRPSDPFLLSARRGAESRDALHRLYGQ